MKTNFLFYKKLLFLILSFGVANVYAQDKKADLKTLLENKSFAFKAESVLPTSMAMRHVTGDNYSLRLSGDSLFSFLPYFGRAYSAPFPGTSGGYNFISTDFDYSAIQRKKGRWDILIRPKDVNDLREFFLTVSANGNASLKASSNNRQPITYNGYMVEPGK